MATWLRLWVSQAAGDKPALARGFAVVTTDSGHKGSVFDGSFFRDQQATLDFYYVAIGRVAQLAKEMIASYYRRGGAAFLFRRLLHGRPRGDDHVAALSGLFRRHHFRRSLPFAPDIPISHSGS